MADAIATAREVIRSRIEEIEADVKRLRGALAELGRPAKGGGRSRSTGNVGRSAARGASRGRKRAAPAGQRREQLLAHLKEKPGSKPQEIASALGITPANAHNVLRKAREERLVRKVRGGGYSLAAAAKQDG